MTETPVIATAPPATDAALIVSGSRSAWLWLALLGFTLLSILGNLLLWGKLSTMQQSLAERSVQAQTLAQEARNLAQGTGERIDSNQGKIAMLEAKVQDMSALNKQVEAILYQATRSQNSNLLMDLESSLRLAQQQAQLTRNVQPLVDSLLQAQSRIEQSPENAVLLKSVLQAFEADLQRLKSANYPDIPAAVDRIDQILVAVDQLPLWVEQQPAARSVSGQAQLEAQSLWQRAWLSARKLLQVERMDGVSSVSLTQEQANLQREQLRLYALSARTALLSGRLGSAHQTLQQLQQRLPQYFDQHSAAYTRMQRLLVEVKSNIGDGKQAPPSVAASIEAIASMNERLSAARPPAVSSPPNKDVLGSSLKGVFLP